MNENQKSSYTDRLNREYNDGYDTASFKFEKQIRNLTKALEIVVRDYENGLLCCEPNGNTEEIVRICREALNGKEVTGL